MGEVHFDNVSCLLHRVDDLALSFGCGHRLMVGDVCVGAGRPPSTEVVHEFRRSARYHPRRVATLFAIQLRAEGLGQAADTLVARPAVILV